MFSWEHELRAPMGAALLHEGPQQLISNPIVTDSWADSCHDS